MITKKLVHILLGVILLFVGVYLTLDFLKVFFKFAIGLILIIIGLYLIVQR